MPYVIGKPSHATGLHPGTRIVTSQPRQLAFGWSRTSTAWLCPCGTSSSSLASARKHTTRKPTRNYPGCAISAAARAPKPLSAMSDSELAAYIAARS